MSRQGVAWVLVLLLASQQVHALREAVDFGAAEALVASHNFQASRLSEHVSAVTENSEFSIKTHWAFGKERKLKWQETEIIFRVVKEGELETVEVEGQVAKEGKMRFRIMPDAAVVQKTLKGMPVVAIYGMQIFDSAMGKFGQAIYEKEQAIYIRAETNPVVGWTKDSLLHWRYAGYELHKPQTGGGKLRPYYIDDDGDFYTVKDKHVDTEGQGKEKKGEPIVLKVKNKEDTLLQKADTDLTVMVDSLLGHTSCLKKTSTCAFRCFYDVEADTCGPVGFCQKWEDWDKMDGVSRLSPLQEQQKCRAMGSEEGHAEADEVLTNLGVKGLKDQALALVGELIAAEPIARGHASKASVKKSLELWQQASDVLNVFEALPARLGKEGGDFEQASARVAMTDMKHWRRRPDRLLTDDYWTAAGKTAFQLHISSSFSVPAKLHSELVNFMIKRPTVVTAGVKQESKEKCVLREDDPATLETFVRYYLGVPGYNPGDLAAGTAQMSTDCQTFLKKMGSSPDVAKTGQAAMSLMKGEKLEEEEAIEAGVEDLAKKDLNSGFVDLGASASPAATQEGDLGSARSTPSLEHGTSLVVEGHGQGESGSAPDPLGGLLETSEEADLDLGFAFILACIIICILCFVVAGMFFRAALWVRRNQPGWDILFVVLLCLGGAVIAGAFCMAWPVGVVSLVLSVALASIKKPPGAMGLAELGLTKVGTRQRALAALLSSPGLAA